MAISAQEFEIILVGIPVLESARPIVTAFFGLYLLVWIDVMQIQHAQIVIAALGAFAAKFLDQFKFAFPVAATFLCAIAVLVPIALLALWRAVPYIARLATIAALAVVLPSGLEITRLGAVNGLGGFGSIKSFATALAGSFAAVLGAVGRNTFKPFVPGATTLA